MALRKLTIIFFFFLLSQTIFAIGFDFDGNFRGIFDNFENKFGPEQSETIFGTNADLSIGFMPSPNNSVHFGVNFFQQFGNEQVGDFFPLISYRFTDRVNHFVFGTIPRLQLISYHEYILSNRWQTRNPVFQGIFFQQHFENLNWSVWADWNGLQSRTRREEFIHGHNLTYTFNLNERNFLDLGWQFIYHHIANRERYYFHDHVIDVGAVVGEIAHRFIGENDTRIQEFRSGVRGMMRYNRQREFTSSYQSHVGAEIFTGIDLGRFDFGLSYYFILHDQTPFPYDFITGDARFLANFGQLDILVRFLQTKSAQVNFMLSFIPTEGGVNHRQTMNVNVPIRR